MKIILKEDNTEIEFAVSSNTKSPDALPGGIAGQAFTLWYKINDEPYIYAGLGASWNEKLINDIEQLCNNRLDFKRYMQSNE